jgi:hypothetical protein
MYIETSKKEDTWYRVLGYLRYRIRFNFEIVSITSRGGGTEDTLYKPQLGWQPLCPLRHKVHFHGAIFIKYV